VSDAADERIAPLERALRVDPGGAAFPALAELYRRAGRLGDAERVATHGLARSPRSLEGRAVLLLVLEDAGRSAEARRQLEAWAGAALAPSALPPMLLPEADALAPDVSDVEFEQAIAAAEPDLAGMITPDSVAEEATLFADGAHALHSPLESGGAFATRTMAELLEAQGDSRGAARIRAALDPPRTPDRTPDAPPAARPEAAAIAALERWLENVRRLAP
jgi:hypothetical protein